MVRGMPFTDPPPTAAWEHVDARAGFEVTFFDRRSDGWRLSGSTTAVEDGQAWIVDYSIDLDRTWTTRRAGVTGRSAAGSRTTVLESVGDGRWLVDGESAPHLDGCFDVDLESSAVTNALPVHRLALTGGERADAPAAYVRVLDLAVERLEQTYQRLADDGVRQRYDYASPAFDFRCRLIYDEAGLVVDYPGIATRQA